MPEITAEYEKPKTVIYDKAKHELLPEFNTFGLIIAIILSICGYIYVKKR